jgi:hypothetical protein
MQKVLLTAVAALALGVPTAKAGMWWILDSADGACVPATRAVNVTRNSSFASPFTLAAEMRRQGRLNAADGSTARRVHSCCGLSSRSSSAWRSASSGGRAAPGAHRLALTPAAARRDRLGIFRRRR